MNEMERLKQLCSQYSLKGLYTYLGITKDTVSRWGKGNGKIPRRWKRMTIEYLEMCNQDIIDFIEVLSADLRK